MFSVSTMPKLVTLAAAIPATAAAVVSATAAAVPATAAAAIPVAATVLPIPAAAISAISAVATIILAPAVLARLQPAPAPSVFPRIPLGRKDQSALISKFNAFFTAKNASLNSRRYLQDKYRLIGEHEGFCGGLAMLWAFKNAIHDLDWFYNTIDKIANCPYENIQDIELEIEKLFSHMEWLQSPDKYYSKMDEKKGKAFPIGQSDVENLFDTRANVIKKISVAEQALLDELDRVDPSDLILLRSQASGKYTVRHAISIAKLGNDFIVYDSNYDDGRAKKVAAKDLFAEIQECFYSVFEFVAPNEIPMTLQTIKLNFVKALNLKVEIPQDPKASPAFFNKSKRKASEDLQPPPAKLSTDKMNQKLKIA